MTKRERESIIRKIAKIEARVAKKRDELRVCVTDIEAVMGSVEEADEGFASVLHNLRSAARYLDREVADKLSEYM